MMSRGLMFMDDEDPNKGSAGHSRTWLLALV